MGDIIEQLDEITQQTSIVDEMIGYLRRDYENCVTRLVSGQLAFEEYREKAAEARLLQKHIKNAEARRRKP